MQRSKEQRAVQNKARYERLLARSEKQDNLADSDSSIGKLRKKCKARKARRDSNIAADNLNVNLRDLFVQPPILNNLVEMAGVPKSAFDAADPALAGLTSPQRRHINAFLATNVGLATAARTVRVSNHNSCIKIPKYDEMKVTSETFFVQCTSYFNAQGYDVAKHHEMLPLIFEGKFKLWFDSKVATIRSWDDFKAAFKTRFDSNLIQLERNRRLHNRRQRRVDPSEEFIYESYNLAKQIDPLEDDSVTLQRIRNSLHPDIATLITTIQPWTLDALLEQVATIHALLDKQCALNKSEPARHPPFEGLREDLIKANLNQTSNSRNSSSRGRGNYRGSYSGNMRNNGYRQNYSQSQSNSGNSSQSNSNYGTNSNQTQSQSYTNSNRGGNNSNSNQQNSSYNQNSGQNSQRGRNNNERARGSQNSNNACRKCLNYGHFARDCPFGQNGGGVAMMGTQQQQQNPPHNQQQNQGSRNYPNDNNSLNYGRRNRDNPNRDYSNQS